MTEPLATGGVLSADWWPISDDGCVLILPPRGTRTNSLLDQPAKNITITWPDGFDCSGLLNWRKPE